MKAEPGTLTFTPTLRPVRWRIPNRVGSRSPNRRHLYRSAVLYGGIDEGGMDLDMDIGEEWRCRGGCGDGEG